MSRSIFFVCILALTGEILRRWSHLHRQADQKLWAKGHFKVKFSRACFRNGQRALLQLTRLDMSSHSKVIDNRSKFSKAFFYLTGAYWPWPHFDTSNRSDVMDFRLFQGQVPPKKQKQKIDISCRDKTFSVFLVSHTVSEISEEEHDCPHFRHFKIPLLYPTTVFNGFFSHKNAIK